MPPEVLLLFFGGLFGIGGIILAGQYIQRSRVTSDVEEEVKRLNATLDSLRDEVGTLRDEVGTIEERVAFNERLLERPKGDDPAHG